MRFRFILLLLVCVAGMAHAQNNGTPNLLLNSDFAQGMTNWWIDNGGNRSVSGLVDAQAGPFRRAVKSVVATPQEGDYAHNVQWGQAVKPALKEGDRLTIKVWLRSPQSGQVGVVVRKSSEPYTSYLKQTLNVTADWKEYEVRAFITEGVPANTAALVFMLNYAAATIEIAGPRLFAFPPQPQLDLQLGHQTSVNSVAFSADGKILATGSGDQSAKLWDTRTGVLLHTIKVDFGVMREVAFSPTEPLLATASDHGIGLWNPQTGVLVRKLNDRTNTDWEANSIVFAPSGKILINGCWDNHVKIWDVTSGALLRTLRGHTAKVNKVAISSDGNWLASGSEDATVKLWDARTGELKQTFSGNGGPVLSVAFAPDGKTLVSGSQDSTARVWDVASGAVLHKLSGQGASCYAALYSADGTTIFTGDRYSAVRFWDAATGKLLRTIESQQSSVLALALSPDGITLAAAGYNKTAKLWDARTGDELHTLGRAATVFAVAVSPDGKTLVSGDEEERVNFWDTATGELKRTEIQGSKAYCVAFLPNGKLLASGGADGTVKLWAANSRGSVRSLKTTDGAWVSALAFSPDGKTLAAGSHDKTVWLWDVESGQLRRTLAGHTGSVTDIAFSPDGKLLASISKDTFVKLWDASTGSVLQSMAAAPADAYKLVLAFSPDGKLLATGNSHEQQTRIWSVPDGALLMTLKGNRKNSLAFSPDGNTLIGGGEGSVEFRNLQQPDVSRGANDHAGSVLSVCFLRDGQAFFSSGEDGIKLWDAQSGRVLASLITLPPPKDVPLQTAETSATKQQLSTDAPSGYLIITPEGYYSGSVEADRSVRFRLGSDSFPAESFQSHYYRPDLVKLALTGQGVPPISEIKGPYPPLAAFAQHAAATTDHTATVTVETSDDSAVPNVVFFVNGARVDAQNTATQSRPLTSDSRALTADAKALMADAKALTADSRPLSADSRAIPAAHKVTRSFSATLPLPPDGALIKVQAIAFDDDGLQSSRAEMTLTHTKSAAATGTLLGLCVGVSRYKDEKLNLKYADADANALAADLNAQKGLYGATQVMALTNENATTAAVMKALNNLIVQTTRSDTVVISLSGHGWRDEARNFYFATHEVNRNDIAHSALPWNEVVERLTKLSEKSKRVIILLDACHSGSAATNEEMVKAILGANAGVLVFASSRGSEVSLENADWAHGAFTKALLEAAQGKAAPPDEKRVTTLDFIAYVSRRVKALTENQQHPQVPFLQDFDTDAALMHKP